MDGQTPQPNDNQENSVQDDPWAAAFAALNETNQKDTEGTTDDNGGSGSGELGSEDPSNTDAKSDDDGSTDATVVQDEDSSGDQGDVGGSSDVSDSGGEQTGDGDSDLLGVTDEDIEQYRAGLAEEIRDRAITDVSKAFIERGIKHTNGKLGATIEDPDILKYDSDKVPHFYNPDTGREFTGDNPRRQAQEWVDDYNKELAIAFNNSCEEYANKLMQQQNHQLKVLEFAPKYDQLDPVRKTMFDSVIESHEIRSSDGELLGYDCDLDKTLASVDRIVESLQAYGKARQAENPSGSANDAPAASGPALDMKSSSGAVNQSKEPTSLAEAMEMLQNRTLENLRSKEK